MIWSRDVWRLVVVIVLMAITAVLWLFYSFASTYHMFGIDTIATLIHFAAAASTAALAVVLIAQLVLQVGFARLMHLEPTELQRGLVFAVLSFAALAATLAQLGFDLTTIVTTSAIITAVIGLSVQPMLASLLSGLAVDRVVRKGDGVMLNGEAIEITALSWRAVVGQRGDGATVVVPNARLADGTLEILPRDRPAEAEISLTLPVSTAPHRLRDIVAATISDFTEVDTAQPISLKPLGYDRDKGGAVYRVKFWVSHYSKIGSAQNAALRHLWYALRRERLLPSDTQAVDDNLEDASTTITSALRAAAPGRPELGAVSEATAGQLIAAGELLTYGDRERIVLPARCAASMCLLVSGECVQISAPGRSAPHNVGPHPSPADHNLTGAGALARIERLLAERIGPYAGYAVRQAAVPGRGLAEICETVAQEIDDPNQRAAFMRAANPPRDIVHGPGLMFRARRDSGQRIISEPPLRARGHAVFLAAPEAAFTAAPKAPSNKK